MDKKLLEEQNPELAADRENELQDTEMSFVEHLIELRSRLIKILVSVGVIFLALLPFYQKIYEIFAYPVLTNLLPGQQMLAHQPIDVFLTPIKVSLFISVLIAMPIILRQIWLFIAPAMYKKEKKLMLPLVVSSTFLFYLGVLFAYFVILPLLFAFLSKIGANMNGVALMPDITAYLGLSLKLFLAFGIVFEVPIATVILIQSGIVKISTLTAKRPYIILAAFTIGMLLTPPDVFSQTLLAVPMLLLFELGILVAKFLEKKRADNRSN